MNDFALTIIVLVLIFIALLFLGGMTITINPFTVRIEKWWVPVGFILMLTGFIIYVNGERKQGFKEGVNNTLNIIKKEINKNDTK